MAKPDSDWFAEFAEAFGGTVVETRDGWEVRFDSPIDPEDLQAAMESVGPPPGERVHIGFDVLEEETDEETGETTYSPDWVPGSYGRDPEVAWDQADETLDDWGDTDSTEGKSIVGIGFRYF